MVPAFQPDPKLPDPEEARVMRGCQWWTLTELEQTADEMAPSDLPALARTLVENGPPQDPIEVGA